MQMATTATLPLAVIMGMYSMKTQIPSKNITDKYDYWPLISTAVAIIMTSAVSIGLYFGIKTIHDSNTETVSVYTEIPDFETNDWATVIDAIKIRTKEMLAVLTGDEVTAYLMDLQYKCSDPDQTFDILLLQVQIVAREDREAALSLLEDAENSIGNFISDKNKNILSGVKRSLTE